MTKKEVQQRVSQFGSPLSLDKFEWDENTNTFSTEENNLVLDFSEINNCTFKTGSSCTFNTYSYCTFKTGSGCTFNTGSYCTFKTNSYCTFKTGSGCTFNTGSDCTFNTGSNCTFDTVENCVIVRWDIFEVIQPEPNVTIKLNDFDVKGYTVIPESCSLLGKEIEVKIDGKTYQVKIEKEI